MSTNSDKYIQQNQESRLTRLEVINENINSSLNEIKQDIKRLDSEIKQNISEVRQDIKSLDSEIKQNISEIRQDIKSLDSEVRQNISEVRQDIKSLDSEVRHDIRRLDTKIDSNFKWLLGVMIGGFASTIGGFVTLGGLIAHAHHWL